VIPGPRPPEGHDRPVGRDRGSATPGPASGPHLSPAPTLPCDRADVAVTRTATGWAVVTATGSSAVDDLVEGMSLADLIAEEHGARLDPDRSARRSARGPVEGSSEDPADARVAALERTVAQLEHALAARVSTERAIGVLAERHGTTPRSAFESLRREARSQGRPVHELAGEVLETLPAEDEPGAVVLTVAPPSPPAARAPKAADGRR
jgi:ANTAR domain